MKQLVIFCELQSYKISVEVSAVLSRVDVLRAHVFVSLLPMQNQYAPAYFCG